MDHNFASSLAGYLSIGCWLIVFTPQLWENYKRKSGDGLSMTFLVIWLAGDVFNLIGVIMQDLLFTMFILALYYTVADMGLIWQVIYYQRQEKLPAEEEIFASYNNNNNNNGDERDPLLRGGDNSSNGGTSYNTAQQQDTHNSSNTSIQRKSRNTKLFNVISWSLIFSVTALSCYTYYFIHWDKHHKNHNKLSWFPQVMGWTSAILYVGSRIPQILKNWRNKSTEGLSFAMFICAVMGNILFTSSIFLKSTNQNYIIMNLSWIVGSCGTLIFDFIIFIQFFIYDRPNVGKTIV